VDYTSGGCCECSCAAAARRLVYAIPLALARYRFLDW
jgi:hypothetical protein